MSRRNRGSGGSIAGLTVLGMTATLVGAQTDEVKEKPPLYKVSATILAGVLAFLVTIGIVHAGGEKPSSIQWKPYDCSSPLMLPEHGFDVSQLGKGKYRIDASMSQGHFNCIYITFQATNQLVPASVSNPIESTFIIKNQKVVWRSYKTIVEGRPVVRKEAMLPNILPHEKRGSDSDYIWIRIDADSQQILDRLTPDAEGILQDAVKPSDPAKWDPAEWIL